MKAIVDATGWGVAQDSVSPPLFLREFVGKPFLIHVVEKLVRLGVKELYVILHHEADQVEGLLGDGERWGVQAHYFLVRDEERPLTTLAYTLEKWEEELVIWASTSLLPGIDSVQEGSFPSANDSLGWVVAPGTVFGTLEPGVNRETLTHELHSQVAKREIDWSLSCSCQTQWLASLEVALKEPQALLRPTEVRELDNGVWVARDAQVDSTAKLVAPLFLGSQTQVYANATVGPCASVERGSIVDEETTVVGSIVAPYSYVGQHLDLNKSIVDRDRLVHVEHGTELQIDDETILAPLGNPNPTSAIGRSLEKGVAFVLLFLFSPLVLLGAIRRQPHISEAVVLPSLSQSPETMHWFHWDGPGNPSSFTGWLLSLFAVLGGDAHLVGLPPRSRVETEALPRMWRDAYLASKVGIATLADVTPEQSEEGRLTTEMYYIAHASLKTDAKILVSFLLRIISEPRLAQ